MIGGYDKVPKDFINLVDRTTAPSSEIYLPLPNQFLDWIRPKYFKREKKFEIQVAMTN